MTKVINSSVIGPLKQDERFADWWTSDQIPIPFFDNRKLTILFTRFKPEKDATFIDQADQALGNFLQLGKADREKLSYLAYKNCKEFLEQILYRQMDQPLRDIKDENEIWRFIDPTKIYVTRRSRNDRDVYIQIACECAWEQEHGLQFVFRQGKKLTRISEQDGHLTEADAYDKPDEEDELLSKF